MTRRMLINGQRPEELRIAILAGEQLESYQTALAEAGLLRGNIYRGIVANLQGSLNAAFVDFGAPKDGFLAFHDIVETAYHKEPHGGARPHRVDEVLQRGKPILVQITKDPSGSKGAALTSNVSLAGRYLVMTPFDDTRGVSRKVEDEDTRRDLRDQTAGLKVPAGCGLIVRTNAMGQTKTALTRDLAALLRLWKRVSDAGSEGRGPKLLYSDQDLVVQALRDYLDSTISEVLVDTDEAFEKAAAYMKAFMPRTKTKLVRYVDRLPLFSRYNLEHQIESITRRAVDLPGGGSIVIDGTEALTAIDVNSGRAGKGGDPEESLYRVNVEAAKEVARQLRLRDIGGLIVVDFIDMRSSKHRRDVERVLRDSFKADKARTTVGKISPNGLLEVNRQRIKQALEVRTRRVCPTCGGAGSIASPELVAVGLLRRIEAEAAKGGVKAVRVQLHPELADAFQNSRRQELAALEREFDIFIEIIAATGFHRSEERVEWQHREPGEAAAPRIAAAGPAASAADLVMALAGQAADEGAAGDEQAVEGGEEGAGGDRKKRKRRRGGRRQQAEESGREVEAEVEADASAEPEAETEDDEAGGERKKRKRRRGGRRHQRSKARKATEAGGASAPGLPATEPDSGPAPEPVLADTAPEAAADVTPESEHEGRPRRKRRGGRKRGKAGVDGAGAAPEGGGEPPEAAAEAARPASPEPSDGEPDATGADGVEGASKGRRRRRPRRKAKEHAPQQ